LESFVANFGSSLSLHCPQVIGNLRVHYSV
jgi:hypothetical protein